MLISFKYLLVQHGRKLWVDLEEDAISYRADFVKSAGLAICLSLVSGGWICFFVYCFAGLHFGGF